MSDRALHPLDETLMHQVPWPFRFAGTSDHRFFDRHWLAVTDPAGSAGLLAGIAFYKNMGVCDGYVTMQAGRQQHNVRFSRPLAEDFETLRCGDMTVAIVEPFRTVRLTLDANDSPLAADLTFSARYEPYCEAHYIDAQSGRVGQEITRYDQCGRWSGWIDCGGGRVEVDDWWGVRDHSWGYRPGVGGFDRSVADPGLDQTAAPTTARAPMLHLNVFCDTGDVFIAAHSREDAAGRRSYVDGEAITPAGEHIAVNDLQFDISFIPGTRAYDRLTVDVETADDQTYHIEATPLLHAWAYSGTGYDGGFRDEQGLGVWRGHVAEYDVYEHVPPDQVLLDGVPTPPGHREQPTLMTVNGSPAVGYCPVMTRGALPRYGLR
jgi:hypothetical protein